MLFSLSRSKGVELVPYGCGEVLPAISESKIVYIIQDMMLSDFLQEMSASTYKQCVCTGKAPLRHPSLLHVLEQIIEGLPSIQCLGLAALDEVVFLE